LRRQGREERKRGTILRKGIEQKNDDGDLKRTRMEIPGLY
jgi:hypothetical protein